MPKVKNHALCSARNAIGKNIRTIRKMRGMTDRQLADAFTEKSELCITANAVSSWERGERSISAEELYFLSEALAVPVNDLTAIGKRSEENLKDFIDTVTALPDEELRTLLYAATVWNGDNHAIIKYIAMYMSLNDADRAELFGMGMIIYEKALENGTLRKGTPKVDVEYIEHSWRRLIKRK